MSRTSNSVRTPLARVRGLGAARHGVGDWWMQRVTAVALVPLTLWLVASIVALAGADYRTVANWMGSPITAPNSARWIPYPSSTAAMPASAAILKMVRGIYEHES